MSDDRVPSNTGSYKSQVENLMDFIHGGITLRQLLEADPAIRDVTAELERLAVQHWDTIKRVKLLIKRMEPMIGNEVITDDERAAWEELYELLALVPEWGEFHKTAGQD